MLPPELRPSYEDPQLWRRLGPELERHYAEIAQIILTKAVKTHEQYCHQMGYIEALQWVMDQSRALNKPAPEEREEEEVDY
jgi:hypothetical protein